MVRSRKQKREGFENPVRLSLLEDDVDELESEQKALVHRLNDELASLRKILIGLMVTIAGGAVGTMITFVVTRGG